MQAPKPQCSFHPAPPPRPPSPSELHPWGGPPELGTEGSPSFPRRGTAPQPEDGKAEATATLYLGFKTIPPPLPV